MAAPLQTMALTFEQIRNRPTMTAWVPLGNFMHQWFGDYPTHRSELVKQSLSPHDPYNAYEHQWATFCAASVLYLCEKYTVPCPTWANNPIYTLKDREPWFFFLNHDRLRQTTPAVFASRNIFCGDDVYANKYEFMDEFYALMKKRRSA